MSKSIKVYILIFVLSLAYAYYVSDTGSDHGKTIEFFNLGTNKIESLNLEGPFLKVEIFKKDIAQSSKLKKMLSQFKNKSTFMVLYQSKFQSKDKKVSDTDPLIFRGSIAVNKYLDLYCPLYISKIIETEDLASFGFSEDKDKIVIKTNESTKTLWVGEQRHDSSYRYYYDPDAKSMFLASDELYSSLISVKSKLISYELTDIKEEDISSFEFTDLSRGEEPKKLYKVLTMNQSMGWSNSQTGQEDPKLSRFVQFIVSIPVISNTDQDFSDKTIYEVKLISNESVIEIIKIAKDNDEFYGVSNYSGSWVKLDKRSLGFLSDMLADI